jgi:hypothetical protein
MSFVGQALSSTRIRLKVSPLARTRPAGHTAPMKRNWRVVVEVIGLVGLVLVALYLGRQYPPGSGIHWSNLERIDNGMSRAEAVAMIGFPPQTEWPGDPIGLGPPATQTTLMWSGDECDIWVFLDGNDRVIGRQGIGNFPPSWFDRIRNRLGL